MGCSKDTSLEHSTGRFLLPFAQMNLNVLLASNLDEGYIYKIDEVDDIKTAYCLRTDCRLKGLAYYNSSLFINLSIIHNYYVILIQNYLGTSKRQWGKYIFPLNLFTLS